LHFQIKTIVVSFVIVDLFAYVLFAESTQEGIVQAFSQKYAEFKTLACSFDQAFTNENFGNEIKQSGKLFIEKPGKMRWQYDSPERKDIISDGKNLWVYREAQKQAFLQPGFENMKGEVGLSFLWGSSKLDSDFDVSVNPKSTDGMVDLALTPKVPNNSIDFITLRFDEKSLHLTEAVLVDKQRNKNHFTFDHIEFDAKLAVSFAPPTGVEILGSKSEPTPAKNKTPKTKAPKKRRT
jgi:outer membrane lipoprotein carrier protein